LINDNVIEAIIGLPPGLFYGTGIPACVLVCNKNKPDELRDKILFINADREYAEGKAQNKLRPEDIEKMTSSSLTRERFSNTAAWWTKRRSWRSTTITSTFAVMWTTPQIPSLRMCRPI
jgi:type I restriction-modification system DNA methylase subunit